MLLEISLLIFGSGLFARRARNEAAEITRQAHASYQRRNASYQAARTGAAEAINNLAAQRAGLVRWLAPRAQNIYRRSDKYSKRSYFGQKTEEEISALIRKIQGIDFRDPRIFDSAVMVSSGAVALAQGLSRLDAAGHLHIPALHEHIGDLTASIPLPEGVAHALSALEIADVISGVGLVFSVFRLANNIRGTIAEEANQRAFAEKEELLGKAETQATEVLTRATAVSRDLNEASYQVYKWTWLMENASPSDSRRTGWFANLSNAAMSFWTLLEKAAIA